MPGELLELTPRERRDRFKNERNFIAALSTYELTLAMCDKSALSVCSCVSQQGLSYWETAELIRNEILKRGHRSQVRDYEPGAVDVYGGEPGALLCVRAIEPRGSMAVRLTPAQAREIAKALIDAADAAAPTST